MKFEINLKHLLALASILLITSSTFAQPFEIAHTSITFFDSDRNREVTTEIYYPADNSGDNEPIAIGDFPVVVFGHGFLMSWDAYENIWTEVVPNGYVICFATTEMGFAPSHEAFGEDLKFLANQMQLESQNSGSLFFNSLAEQTALMGHSMGGGASFLAAEDNSEIHTLINFAAAETTPSAIAAAGNISVPSLLFSGDDDCVTPASDHQDIMYEALNSDCKTQIKIINGGHCYFANNNFNCELGESFCNGNLNISRAEQQAVTNDFLSLWLDYSLKGNQTAFTVFNDSLQTSNRINFSQACTTVGLSNANTTIEIDVFPNPLVGKLNLHIPTEYTGGQLSIHNLLGQEVFQSSILNAITEVNLTAFPKGSYLLLYQKDLMVTYKKLVKVAQ